MNFPVLILGMAQIKQYREPGDRSMAAEEENSFTAKVAKIAEEGKSLTAKVATDAKSQ